MPKLRPTRSPFHRPAIQTLERLHSEFGGQILENKNEALELAEQMRHVEAVIKMLDPTFNLRRIAVKRRQPKRPTPSRCFQPSDAPAGHIGGWIGEEVITYPVRKCWRSSTRARTLPTVSTRVVGLDGRSSRSNANPMTAHCPVGVDTGQKSKREASNG
jgi:hypothetical protein